MKSLSSLADSLMQLQADLLGINTVRPSMPETTALGAAMAAGKHIAVIQPQWRQ